MTSRSQIDKLGEQLRNAVLTNQPLDVKSLDDYRRSFLAAADEIKVALNTAGLTDYTERTKSTPSIRDKLVRQQQTRLTQIQDIVGLRFVVDDLIEQDKVIGLLSALFENLKTMDRRARPTFGYRAVHLIVTADGKQIEIQVRSYLQHLWAQSSEMISDIAGQELKYGGGDPQLSRFLLDLSARTRDYENQRQAANLSTSRHEMEDEFTRLSDSVKAQFE